MSRCTVTTQFECLSYMKQSNNEEVKCKKYQGVNNKFGGLFVDS